MYRCCERLDFFRLMSFYYGGVGHYMACAMIIMAVVIIIYFMLGLAIYHDEGIGGQPMSPEGTLQLCLAGMGLLQTMPLVIVLMVEKGFIDAIQELGYMILSGGPLYFIFQIGTKSYYFQQTLLAGGAMYRPTGRGFVTRHSPFDENYRFFASSHIYLGFELMVALLLFKSYTTSKQYLGLTWSLWLVVFSFVFGPYWFNPLSFETMKISEDYKIWMTWMCEKGGLAGQSWESWYKEESAFVKGMSPSWKLLLLIIRCTLWSTIGYGMVYPKLIDNKVHLEKFSTLFLVFAFYFSVNWVLNKLERHWTYATRRFAHMLLSVFVTGVIIYLFVVHEKYFIYSIAVYYFASALCFFVLLMGGSALVSTFYKLHDYLVCHFIFVVLFILSLVQVGYCQTWLLYYNALSSGVVIEDILKYARKSKESASENEEVQVISELKAQLADQQQAVRQLYQSMADRFGMPPQPAGRSPITVAPTGEVELSERTALLALSHSVAAAAPSILGGGIGGGGGGAAAGGGYGSVGTAGIRSIPAPIPVRAAGKAVASLISNSTAASASPKQPSPLKTALKGAQTAAATAVLTAESVSNFKGATSFPSAGFSGLSGAGTEPNILVETDATGAVSGSGGNMPSAASQEFQFKQPTHFPKRA